jgi:hypothetical protein
MQASGIKVTEILGVLRWLPLRLWLEKFINPFRLNDQAGIGRFTMFPINAGCRYRSVGRRLNSASTGGSFEVPNDRRFS